MSDLGLRGSTLTTCCRCCVQIKEKLLQLTLKRKDMIDKWEDRWECLRLGRCRRSHVVPLACRGAIVTLSLRTDPPTPHPTLLPNSPGGAAVLPGRRRGRGLASGPGVVPVRPGDGPKRGRGGEAPQTTRSLREVRRHLGGAILSAGTPHRGPSPSKAHRACALETCKSRRSRRAFKKTPTSVSKVTRKSTSKLSLAHTPHWQRNKG